MRNTDLKRRLGGAGCLSALLRVLRPSASPLTYAKRSGNQLGVVGFAGLDASYLGALLRVPRAARSSLTYAKRSGNRLGAAGSAGLDASCLGALLRVPRASRSSLTYAKRPGNSPGEMAFADAQADSPRDMTRFAAMGAVCPTQRSEGGARRAGDMSGVGYASPVASSATDGFENQAQQFKPNSIEQTPE
jgi:hypothetical protein